MDKSYKHILVPLDGSELAELALPDALSLARMSQAEVTLLQVVPLIEDVIGAGTEHAIYVDEQWAAHRELAVEYLNAVCEQPECEDLTIHRVVEMGSAAEMIIDYAHHHPIDLIVMATHGRSGLQRWVYGSVADKVLRGADVPTLLVRAHTGQKAA